MTLPHFDHAASFDLSDVKKGRTDFFPKLHQLKVFIATIKYNLSSVSSSELNGFSRQGLRKKNTKRANRIGFFFSFLKNNPPRVTTGLTQCTNFLSW